MWPGALGAPPYPLPRLRGEAWELDGGDAARGRAAAARALSWHRGIATHPPSLAGRQAGSGQTEPSLAGSMKRAHPEYSSSDSEELDEPIEVEKESADENG